MPRARSIDADAVIVTICMLTRDGGCAPSFDELAGALGFASKHNLYRYLLPLRDEGRIAWDRRPRTLRVLDADHRGSRSGG